MVVGVFNCLRLLVDRCRFDYFLAVACRCLMRAVAWGVLCVVRCLFAVVGRF